LTDGLATLRLRSINHHTCGLPSLADLSASADRMADLQSRLHAARIASVALTTCHRTELYWLSHSEETDALANGVLGEAVGLPLETLQRLSADLAGEAAARHLFRVCAGLESLVLGEAEVLGQVRSALERSPSAGPFLTGVFRAAIRAGRAARAETAIGTGALSVASVAVNWLGARLPLADARVLLVGAGDTAAKVGRHLRALGTRTLVVANRTPSRGQALAADLNGSAVALDDLEREIAQADAMVSAVNASSWIVTGEQLRRRAAQRAAPFMVVDLSMPPSIEPDPVDGVIRMDLTGVEAEVRVHRQQREAEIFHVERVIARELTWLDKWAAREALRPLMAARWKKADGAGRDDSAALDERAAE
jgi:glutamyl-tRNA reductase